MTEDEAKTKWCPQTRAFVVSGVSYANKPAPDENDDGRMTHEKTLCVASACMVWRYRESPEFKAKADRAYQRDGTVMKLNEGFCGLAGQP